MKKQKKKVIYLCNWYNSIYNNLFNSLDKDIEIIMVLSNKFPFYEKNKYKVVVLPVSDIADYLYFYKKEPNAYLLKYGKELEELFLREKPDIVITNLFYLPSTVQAASLCRKHSIPFFLQTELKRMPSSNIDSLLFKAFVKTWGEKIIETTNLLIPWVKESEEYFKKNFPSIKEKIVEAILPGVDTKIFFPKKEKSSTHKSNRLEVLMVGRFVAYKKHSDIIRAVAALHAEKIPVRLTLIGEGPTLAKNMLLAKELGIKKQVLFLGKIPYQNIVKYYRETDIFVLPSFNEAIGISVSEAMACQVPCVISDTCGAKDYVEEGVSGLIFETGSVTDLIQKIKILLDKKLRIKMGKEAAKRIKKEFSLEKQAKKMSKLIKGEKLK